MFTSTHVARRQTTGRAAACPGRSTRVSCERRRWQGVEAVTRSKSRSRLTAAPAPTDEAAATRRRRWSSSPAPSGGAGGPRFCQEARPPQQPHRTRQLESGGGAERVLIRQMARRAGCASVQERGRRTSPIGRGSWKAVARRASPPAPIGAAGGARRRRRVREAGLTAAHPPTGDQARKRRRCRRRQVTRACEQCEEVASRDDASTPPRGTRRHESTRSYLLQSRRAQAAAAPAQRQNAAIGDAKKGYRAPARASRLADAPRHASSATRCRDDGVRGGGGGALCREATLARRSRQQLRRQQPHSVRLPAANATRHSGRKRQRGAWDAPTRDKPSPCAAQHPIPEPDSRLCAVSTTRLEPDPVEATFCPSRSSPRGSCRRSCRSS